jgi:hypothetical protein
MVIEAMGRKPAGSIAKQTLPGWPWQRQIGCPGIELSGLSAN